MRTKTTIKKVTYDELVALLDTYSSFWSVKFDNDVYKKFNKKCEALEEACATMLLGGENIKVLDYMQRTRMSFTDTCHTSGMMFIIAWSIQSTLMI